MKTYRIYIDNAIIVNNIIFKANDDKIYIELTDFVE